jgi:hypothetical protein
MSKELIEWAMQPTEYHPGLINDGDRAIVVANKQRDINYRFLDAGPLNKEFIVLRIDPVVEAIDLSVIFGLYEYDEGLWATKVGGPWSDSPDWVIVRGGHIDTQADWIRTIQKQCAAAATPFYFAGWGEWCPARPSFLMQNGETITAAEYARMGHHIYPGRASFRVGAERAGCLLDGTEYKELPNE